MKKQNLLNYIIFENERVNIKNNEKVTNNCHKHDRAMYG